MTMQTPEMVAQSEPTAIIVSFWASESGVRLNRITGLGPWIKYFAEVVDQFPPTEWEKHAVGLVVDFLRLEEVRDAVAADIADMPQRPLESPSAGRPSDVGLQRRRRITPEHLQEVAKIYAKAQDGGEPPTRAVQYHFDVSHSTAAKWVGAARKSDLLPQLEAADD